jgi:XTP/dITP diphosphohydrolase
MDLIFATNNQYKIIEIQAIIGNCFRLISLKDAGINIDIPEPYDTLEENARTKCVTIFEMTNADCFSEDTGLEVDALNGAPGVKSARYSGEGKAFDKNIEKLLYNLSGQEDRKARFRTVICLIFNKKQLFFEGICEGSIDKVIRGNGGFGYDPVFIPTGSSRTFAEMTLEEKNIFSHRKKAISKLIDFLQSPQANIA